VMHELRNVAGRVAADDLVHARQAYRSVFAALRAPVGGGGSGSGAAVGAACSLSGQVHVNVTWSCARRSSRRVQAANSNAASGMATPLLSKSA